MKLSAGAFSDAGRVRDNNEDAHVVDDRLALFAVADGMGGHVAGEVASWTAIEALRAAVANGRASTTRSPSRTTPCSNGRPATRS